MVGPPRDRLNSEKAIRSLIEGDLVKALGDRKVSDIRRRHVIEVIEAKAEVARLADRRTVAASGHIFEAWPGTAVSNAALARAVDRTAGALPEPMEPRND